MQGSLLPIKLPEDRTTTLRYDIHVASETSCPPWRNEGTRFVKLERLKRYKLQFIALVDAYSLSPSPRITSTTTIHICNAERYGSVCTYWRILSNECCTGKRLSLPQGQDSLQVGPASNDLSDKVRASISQMKFFTINYTIQLLSGLWSCWHLRSSISKMDVAVCSHTLKVTTAKVTRSTLNETITSG